MAASKVTDLRQRRIERLAGELEPYLRRGHAIVEVDRVPSADEWRAAARLATRRNGWQVRAVMERLALIDAERRSRTSRPLPVSPMVAEWVR